MSLAGRLLNVFATPGEVFDGVRVSPRSVGNWLVPWLLGCVAAVVYTCIVFSQPAVMAQVREQQVKAIEQKVQAGKLNAAQAQQAEQVMANMGPTLIIIFGSIGAVIGGSVWLFGLALVLWLLGRWVLKARFDYLKAVEVAGLAGMISVLNTIISMLLAVMMGSVLATAGPVLLIREIDPTNKTHLMLSSLNALTVWYVAILALGWARLSGVSFGKTAAWLFGLWLLLRLVLILTGLAVSGM